MGIEYSFFQVINNYMSDDEIITEPDGRIIKRKNPYIQGLAIASVSLIMAMYMDGGKGMITKILGRKCIECNQ
jgi:hypothetical protein